jgi:hypothetical protein
MGASFRVANARENTPFTESKQRGEIEKVKAEVKV